MFEYYDNLAHISVACDSNLYFYFEERKEVDMEGKLYLCNYNYISTHR